MRADLHANPKHPLFESIAWDAENGSPVGLSHDVEAVVKWDEQRKCNVVESITRVCSVDIVHSPATTSSMFESELLVESGDLDSFVDRICTDTEPVQVFGSPLPIVDLDLPPESKADYYPHPLPVFDLSRGD